VRKLRRCASICVLVLAFSALPVGGPPLAGPRDHDHDRVRQAVIRGEIRPLAEILESVRDRLPGEITGVEIERKGEHWVYEFRVVDGNGRLFDVYVDAASGAIERVKEK
jgi:uncharacterized membrane protein YkoI